MGFEPTRNGATIRRVNHFTTPATYHVAVSLRREKYFTMSQYMCQSLLHRHLEFISGSPAKGKGERGKNAYSAFIVTRKIASGCWLLAAGY